MLALLYIELRALDESSLEPPTAPVAVWLALQTCECIMCPDERHFGFSQVDTIDLAIVPSFIGDPFHDLLISFPSSSVLFGLGSGFEPEIPLFCGWAKDKGARLIDTL